MTGEQSSDAAERGEQNRGDAWREVGEQFRELGKSLALAFRATLESEETRKHMHSLRAGLEAMADEVGQAIREAVPEAQQVRLKAEQAAHTAKETGQQALEEARPHLLSALRLVNSELQELIDRMEQQAPTPGARLVERIAVEMPEAEARAPEVVEMAPLASEAPAPAPPETEEVAPVAPEAPVPAAPEAEEMAPVAPEASVPAAPETEEVALLAAPQPKPGQTTAPEEPADTIGIAQPEPPEPAPPADRDGRQPRWWQFWRR